MSSTMTVVPPSVWSSAPGRFSWTSTPSKLKSGTQQDLSATGLLPQRGYTHTYTHAYVLTVQQLIKLLPDDPTDITGGQSGLCWCMTSASTWPTRARSDGWKSCTSTQTLTLWWCWWETRETWRTWEQFPQRRPRPLQVRYTTIHHVKNICFQNKVYIQ